MNFRFTASVCGMALAIAAGAAAQAGPAPAAADRIQPYFAVRTVETFDSNGKSLSASYALEERDSHGRRLSAPISSPDQRGQLTRATVWDPVKVRMIEINYTAHVATVTQFPPGAVTHLLPPTQPFMTDDPNRSDLPEKSLNDFKVKGYTWKTEDPSAAADATAATPPPRQQAIGFSMTVYPLTHEFWWSPGAARVSAEHGARRQWQQAGGSLRPDPAEGADRRGLRHPRRISGEDDPGAVEHALRDRLAHEDA